MRTKAGYETNGDYIKLKSGFTQFWVVETSIDTYYFESEKDADLFIENYLHTIKNN